MFWLSGAAAVRSGAKGSGGRIGPPPVRANVFRAELHAFQVPSIVPRQHYLIKSNLLLKDALDIWLHQKKNKNFV